MVLGISATEISEVGACFIKTYLLKVHIKDQWGLSKITVKMNYWILNLHLVICNLVKVT
jgi:hypothetical protein